MKVIEHYLDDVAGFKDWQHRLMQKEYPSLEAARSDSFSHQPPSGRLIALENADVLEKRELLFVGEERMNVPDPRPEIRMVLAALEPQPV